MPPNDHTPDWDTEFERFVSRLCVAVVVVLAILALRVTVAAALAL